MLPMRTREVHLVRRPKGRPVLEDFALVEQPLAPLDAGQALVRNIFMAVDPAMRLRMRDEPSYAAPFQVGEPLEGRAVGQILASRIGGLVPGDLVTSTLGWREHAVAVAGELQALDPGPAPLSAHVGVLGPTGLAAYVGMLDIGRPASGETVVVSAATGGVGSIAGQLAKLRGSRVVGVVRGEARRRVCLDDLGFAAAVDARAGDLVRSLGDACPSGIDVFFDNVGGDILEAAIALMARDGRIVMCGMASQYDHDRPPPGPRNLFRIVSERLTVRGFIVYDHLDRRPAFLAEVGGRLADGSLVARETVIDGLARAPAAFLALVGAGHVGKMVVRLGDDPA